MGVYICARWADAECRWDIIHSHISFRKPSWFCDSNAHKRTFPMRALTCMGQWSALNRKAASLVCFEAFDNPLPRSESWILSPAIEILQKFVPVIGALEFFDTRSVFFMYLRVVVLLATLWVAVCMLDLLTARCIKAPCDDKSKVVDLAEDIELLIQNNEALEDHATALSNKHGVTVKCETRLSLMVEACFFFLGMVSDVLQIINFFLSYDYKFAAALTIIKSMSFFREVDATHRGALQELHRSMHAGVMTDAWYAVRLNEQGFEAASSLVITVYAFPFAASAPLALLNSLFNVAKSSYALAKHSYEQTDLGMRDV